jgi:FkbM family methyltransferase
MSQIESPFRRWARSALVRLMPRQKRLQFRYMMGCLLKAHEIELFHLPLLCPKGRSGIDVGANAGMYAYKLSSLLPKVYAFEINAELTEDLRAYHAPNIEIIPTGLSSKADSATLYIPKVHGIRMTGWASLEPNDSPEVSGHETMDVKITKLDSFDFDGVGFIKIDVEGHELHVLEGGMRTLRASRPSILVESKPPNLEPLRALLGSLDYEEKTLLQLAGVAGSPDNYIFFPRERDS